MVTENPFSLDVVCAHLIFNKKFHFYTQMALEFNTSSQLCEDCLLPSMFYSVVSPSLEPNLEFTGADSAILAGKTCLDGGNKSPKADPVWKRKKGPTGLVLRSLFLLPHFLHRAIYTRVTMSYCRKMPSTPRKIAFEWRKKLQSTGKIAVR